MKKILFGGLFLLFSGVAHATPGVVVEAKGIVTAQFPGAKPKPAATGIEFPDGTKFVASKGATATLMLMDGAMQTVVEGKNYIAGKVKPTKVATPTSQKLLVALNEAVQSTGSGPTVHGMVKMTPGVPLYGEITPAPPIGGITALFPNNTALILPDAIRFQWEAKNGLSGKNLAVVFFEKGKPQMNFPIKPADSSVTLTAVQLQLQKGVNYYWYLGEKQGKEMIAKSQRFSVSILSDADEKLLAADLQEIDLLGLTTAEGKNFLKSQVYYRYKMYAEMKTLLDDLYAKEPTIALKRLLFLTNVRLGNLAAAKQYQI